MANKRGPSENTGTGERCTRVGVTVTCPFFHFCWLFLLFHCPYEAWPSERSIVVDCEVHLLSLGAAVEVNLVPLRFVGAWECLTHHGKCGLATGLEIQRDHTTRVCVGAFRLRAAASNNRDYQYQGDDQDDSGNDQVPHAIPPFDGC